ncbi:Druantia anti-phage system protein DruA, partial [Streptomyces sp. JAC18]
MKEEAKPATLSLPADASRQETQAFARLCTLLASAPLESMGVNSHDHWIQAAKIKNLYEQPLLAAAAYTAIDLVDQGWTIQAAKPGPVFTPPLASGDRETEKARVQRKEHLRRDKQLRQSSVRRFVERMERTHQHGDRLISIFDLMRDGRELAGALQSAG